jgi:hypothetical protein
LKGDTGAQGPQGPQGEKGDAFEYSDFTPAQLAALTGPQGPQGERGNNGKDGKDGLTTSISVNGNTYTQNNGTVTLPNYPTSLPASNIKARFVMLNENTNISPTIESTDAINGVAIENVICYNYSGSDKEITLSDKDRNIIVIDGGYSRITIGSNQYAEISYLLIKGDIYGENWTYYVRTDTQ